MEIDYPGMLGIRYDWYVAGAGGDVSGPRGQTAAPNWPQGVAG